MRIYIDTLVGQSFDLLCSPTDTVSDVKDLLRLKTKINSEQISLVYRNERLRDQQTLSDARIRNGTHLTLVVSLQTALTEPAINSIETDVFEDEDVLNITNIPDHLKDDYVAHVLEMRQEQFILCRDGDRYAIYELEDEEEEQSLPQTPQHSEETPTRPKFENLLTQLRLADLKAKRELSKLSRALNKAKRRLDVVPNDESTLDRSKFDASQWPSFDSKTKPTNSKHTHISGKSTRSSLPPLSQTSPAVMFTSNTTPHLSFQNRPTSSRSSQRPTSSRRRTRGRKLPLKPSLPSVLNHTLQHTPLLQITADDNSRSSSPLLLSSRSSSREVLYTPASSTYFSDDVDVEEYETACIRPHTPHSAPSRRRSQSIDHQERITQPLANNSLSSKIILPSITQNNHTCSPAASSSLVTVNHSRKPKKNRCPICQTKLKLMTGYDCRCGNRFCSLHRYPEEHSCSFNHSEFERKQLADRMTVSFRNKVKDF